jgi:hypothetical protein
VSIAAAQECPPPAPEPAVAVITVHPSELEDLAAIRARLQAVLSVWGGACSVRLALRWDSDQPGEVEAFGRCAEPTK